MAAEDARDALRILISFQGLLDGAVKIEDKLMVAGEISKVDRILSGFSKRMAYSEPASEAGALLADFAKLLPEYNNRDFRTRRIVRDKLKRIITLTARIVAIGNKIAKGESGE